MNLHDGGFLGSLTVREHSSIPFGQVIEISINRSCKDIGGLSQIIQNEPSEHLLVQSQRKKH